MVEEEVTKNDRDERMWGMLSHLLALTAFIGVPFGHILGPLIVWLIKKEQFPFVNEQGKESLNFQISMSIYAAIAYVLFLLLIGIPLLIALGIMDIVFVIIAAVAANDGRSYSYPLTIRFIK